MAPVRLKLRVDVLFVVLLVDEGVKSHAILPILGEDEKRDLVVSLALQ